LAAASSVASTEEKIGAKVTGLPVFDGTPEFYLAYSLAKDTDGNLYAGMLTDIPPWALYTKVPTTEITGPN